MYIAFTHQIYLCGKHASFCKFSQNACNVQVARISFKRNKTKNLLPICGFLLVKSTSLLCVSSTCWKGEASDEMQPVPVNNLTGSFYSVFTLVSARTDSIDFI